MSSGPGQLMYRADLGSWSESDKSKELNEVTVWNEHKYDIMLPFESTCADDILDFHLLASKFSDERSFSDIVANILAKDDEQLLNSIEMGASLEMVVYTIRKRFAIVIQKHIDFVTQLPNYTGEASTSFVDAYNALVKKYNRLHPRLKALISKRKRSLKEACALAKKSFNTAYMAMFAIQHLLAVECGMESQQPFYFRNEELVPIVEENRLLLLNPGETFTVPPNIRLAHVLHLRWDQTEMDKAADVLLGEPSLSDKIFNCLPQSTKSLPGTKSVHSPPLNPFSDSPFLPLDDPFPRSNDFGHLKDEDLSPSEVRARTSRAIYDDPPVRLADLFRDEEGHGEESELGSFSPIQHPMLPSSLEEAERPRTLCDLLDMEEEFVSPPSLEVSLVQSRVSVSFDSPASGALRSGDFDPPDNFDISDRDEHFATSPSSTSPPTTTPSMPRLSLDQSPASSRHTSPQNDLDGTSPTRSKLSPPGRDPLTASPLRTDSESNGTPTSPSSPSTSSPRPLSTIVPFESNWSTLKLAHPGLDAGWKSLLDTILRSLTLPSHLCHLDKLLHTLSTVTLPGTTTGTLKAGVAGTLVETIFTPKKPNRSQEGIVKLSCNASSIYFVPANTPLAVIRVDTKRSDRRVSKRQGGKITLPHDVIVFPHFEGDGVGLIPKSGEKVQSKTILMRWAHF